MSVYLGVEHGRRDLAAWEDLEQAATGGLLIENHWIELKKDIPNKPGANVELARDLASLAADGGILIIGIQEKDSRADKVVGVALKDMQERIEQVAAMHIHPRLYFRVRTIPHPDNPDLACVLVEVPASGQAPHQVDFAYWGRTETTKDRLADGRVREILAVREASLRRTGTDLAAIPDGFPIGQPSCTLGHLYVIADPIDADRHQLTALLDQPDHQTLDTAMTAAATTIQRAINAAGQPLWSASRGWRARHNGLALTTVLGDAIKEKHVLEYRVRRDSGIEIVCGSGTSTYRSRWQSLSSPDETPNEFKSVSCAWVLAIVHSTLALAAALTEHSHYQGRWQLGVLFDGMRGAVAYEALSTASGGEQADQYSADRYEELTSTTTAELVDNTPAAVEKLVGNFLRGLDMQRRFLPYAEWHAKGRVTPKTVEP
jgi:schlafen family protein